MKDTKIFVDLDDEITFISEKILKAETNRVILVIPERSGIITSLVGLKMLRKVIDKNDKDVVIVTMDDQGRNIALNAGFITAAKIGEVDQDTWREAVRLKKRIHDANFSSNKVPFRDDIYQTIDNSAKTNEPEKFFEYKDDDEPQLEKTPPSVNKIDSEKAIPVPPTSASATAKENIKRVEFNKEPVIPTKKVSLDGFDLIAGGDIASFSDTDKEEKNIPTEKNFESIPKDKKEGMSNVFKSNFFKDQKDNIKRNKLIIFASIFILLLIFIIYYLFLTKSSVDIAVKGTFKKSTALITVSPNVSSVDGNSLTIPSQLVSVNESGSDSIPTTGQKTVQQGNYAQGSVIFYNTSSNPVTIPTGTTFTDQNNVSFQTPSSVSVPAAQSSITGTTNGQSSSVNVTLNTNNAVGKGDTFSNSSYPSITASNSSDFSQGNATTTQEQVVAQSDVNNLEQTLSQNLFSRGESKISSINPSIVVVTQSIKNVVVNKTFDHSVGAVAQVLNLSMSTKTEAQGYKPSDIKSAIEQNISNSGNIIKSLNYNITKTYIGSSGDIKIQVSYTGDLFKNINKENILNQIKGKSFSQAISIIKENKNVNSVNIKDNPDIFSIIGFLPSNIKNISINIINS